MLRNFKFNLKMIKELDVGVLLITIAIAIFGVINIYLATFPSAIYAKRQAIWLLVSLVAMYIILTIQYEVLEALAPIVYWGSVILLVYTGFFGKVVNGARGWIVIGGFTMQAAELAKVGIIMILAKKLKEMDMNINNVKNFFILAGYILIPVILIVIQPDMGMTMVCFFIVLGIFFCSGLDIRVIGWGFFSLITAIVIVWNSGLIHDYQKTRLTSFLNPESDPLGAGHQVIQSKIAIGSGGTFGKGMSLAQDTAQGYSTRFVPENHTDFIFSVIGEHWGTLGIVLLLVLYCILMYKFIKIAKTARDAFGSVLCIGLTSYFIFAILQNIGMNIGIMPITGITLPLISYGGSSMFTTITSIALIMNVGMRRKKITF